MHKDYVLDHDWGSYNSNDTVNKLLLRNEEDFFKYFDKEILNQYNAQVIDKYTFRFEDGETIQFVVEIKD